MNNKYKLAGLILAFSLTFAACSNNEKAPEDTQSTEVKETVTDDSSSKEATDSKDNDQVESTEEAVVVPSSKEVELGEFVLHRGYSAAHGEDSVARIVVLTSGDKIVDVALDEFQYFDEGGDFVGLPNSDAAFGEGAVEGKILGSKLENNEAYSALMAEHAQSTVSIADNYKAIVDFAKGKTISELEDSLSGAVEGEAMDAVTGATLVDTANYLKSIVEVAKDNKLATNVNSENIDSVVLHQVYGAPHGDKSFGDAVVAVEGDKIVGASIDEYQYFGQEGLPNSKAGFGSSYADSSAQLASKLVNDEAYSALMAKNAGSTVTIKDNFRAITDFVTGKTVDEIQAVIDENKAGEPVDAVSEATLVDTVGYLKLILDATKN